MSAHAARAFALLEMRRPEDALAAFGDALAENPEDADALAGTAHCHLLARRHEAATSAARAAIAIDPASTWSHHTLARVALRRNRFALAETHALEALRLGPGDADNYALLGFVEAYRDDVEAVLAAAEAGLEADAEHVECANLRAIALLELGRRDDAAVAAAETLRFAPDDPRAHTTRAYAALHLDEPAAAFAHFREALRLDPMDDWARAGLVLALKAKWAPYRLWLAAKQKLVGLPPPMRWVLVSGGALLARKFLILAQTRPEIEPLAEFAAIAFIAAFYVILTIESLGNVVLLFHPIGRHALTETERRAAMVIAALMLVGALFAAWAMALDHEPAGFAAAVALSLPMAVAGWSRTEPGTHARAGMGAIALGCATLGALAVGLCLLLPTAVDTGGTAPRTIVFVATAIVFLVSGGAAWAASTEDEKPPRSRKASRTPARRRNAGTGSRSVRRRRS